MDRMHPSLGAASAPVSTLLAAPLAAAAFVTSCALSAMPLVQHDAARKPIYQRASATSAVLSMDAAQVAVVLLRGAEVSPEGLGMVSVCLSDSLSDVAGRVAHVLLQRELRPDISFELLSHAMDTGLSQPLEGPLKAASLPAMDMLSDGVVVVRTVAPELACWLGARRVWSYAREARR